jgi:thioredoxin reductase
VGLVAAVQLLARGETPIVLEAGDSVGASIREWGHVGLFSPWKYVVEPTARGWLEATGWNMPDGEALPSGAELLSQWIEPLAALPAVAPTLRLGHRVLSVTRRGYDKVRSAARDTVPFELVVRTAHGQTQRILARAVIDASGTWRSPNPLGSGGLPAEGETALAHRIAYGMPDVLGRERSRYAGQRVLVVGSGHSAFNALLDLAKLREAEPTTLIHWAIRRRDVGTLYGGGARDALVARGAMGARLARLVQAGVVQLTSGLRIVRLQEAEGGVVAEDGDGERIGPVDRIIVATGFRPDLSLTRELRLGLDPWLEAPTALAPLIDPNVHSCGTVYPHGAEELSHPERDYYVVGMKSYGRAPTFLLLTGYEQVRSVACALTGDAEGARQVQLVLPETGVCQSDRGGRTEDEPRAARGSGGGCCGVSPEGVGSGGCGATRESGAGAELATAGACN